MQPLMFFESIYEAPSVVTSSSEAAGFPDENVRAWRLDEPYRWKAASTADGAFLQVDALTAQTPTAVAIGGHNFASLGSGTTWRIQYADAAGGPWTNAFAGVTPPDNSPAMKTFSGTGAHRYWKLLLERGSAFLVAPELGALTLGRSLGLLYAQEDLDPYGVEGVVDRGGLAHGSPLGESVRYVRKMFRLNYVDIGFKKGAFFNTDSALLFGFDTDLVPHAIQSALPFWFAWNLDVDPNDVFLSWVVDFRVSTPFIAGYTRRALDMTIEGYRKVA